MPQNIYDEPVFFEGYRQLRQADSGLNGALEIPALRALLPDLQNLDILDLGCGFGDFARFACAAGAASVVGIDVSHKMIEAARLQTDDPRISYLCMPIEDLAGDAHRADLVVSSLALHYLEDYAGLVAKVGTILRPGGQFIFSVEHPMCTAKPIGWIKSEAGHRLHWPLDDYHAEGERSTRWFVDNVIKFHRTVETYVNTLIDAGLRLTHFGEPKPRPETLAARPQLSQELRRPPFLLLAAAKP